MTAALTRPSRQGAAERQYSPRADLFTSDAALMLQVDLPGVPREGLTVEVKREQLHLTGRRSDTLVYRRILRLPEHIDVEKITAALEDGVLTLTLPKSERARTHRIEVSD